MQVSDVMSRKIQCAKQSDSLQQVARQMRNTDVGMLPVEQKGQIIGTITDRDITIRATAEGAEPGKTPVSTIMSSRIHACIEDDDLQHAASIMEKNQIRRLMVQDKQGKFVGILSLADLARMDKSDELSAEVLEEVSQPSTAH